MPALPVLVWVWAPSSAPAGQVAATLCVASFSPRQASLRHQGRLDGEESSAPPAPISCSQVILCPQMWSQIGKRGQNWVRQSDLLDKDSKRFSR